MIAASLIGFPCAKVRQLFLSGRSWQNISDVGLPFLITHPAKIVQIAHGLPVASREAGEIKAIDNRADALQLSFPSSCCIKPMKSLLVIMRKNSNSLSLEEWQPEAMDWI